MDSSHHVESDRSHRSAITSLGLDPAGSPTDATAVSDNIFKLNAISHIVDLEKSKGGGDTIDQAIDITTPDGKC